MYKNDLIVIENAIFFTFIHLLVIKYCLFMILVLQIIIYELKANDLVYFALNYTFLAL
jgi:hypothetical protein